MTSNVPRRRTRLSPRKGLNAKLRSTRTNRRVLLVLNVLTGVATLGIAAWLIISESKGFLKAVASLAALAVFEGYSYVLRIWKEWKQTEMLLKMNLDDEQNAVKLIDSLIDAKAPK